jgi:ribosomal protein S18 acetylase RimI-like enzyme
LGVIADNEVGNAFYERRGYAVVEEREAELLDATFEEYVREKEL